MKQIALLITIAIMMSCASSSKTTVTNFDTKVFDDMVANNVFEVELEWAQPQITRTVAQLGNSGLYPMGSNSGNISLLGNGNYIRLKGDRVEAILPYFGERQMGGAYNNNANGIEFNGVVDELKTDEGKKDSYIVKFDINDKNNPTESYRVVIQLFPNLKSTVNINSNQRFPIRYRGKVKEIASENES